MDQPNLSILVARLTRACALCSCASTGESYAGVYVPTLSKLVFESDLHKTGMLKLTGWAVGDPCTDDKAQVDEIDFSPEFALRHGVIDEVGCFISGFMPPGLSKSRPLRTLSQPPPTACALALECIARTAVADFPCFVYARLKQTHTHTPASLRKAPDVPLRCAHEGLQTGTVPVPGGAGREAELVRYVQRVRPFEALGMGTRA